MFEDVDVNIISLILCGQFITLTHFTNVLQVARTFKVHCGLSIICTLIHCKVSFSLKCGNSRKLGMMSDEEESAKETSKPRHLILLDSLNKSLVDSERYLYRWDMLLNICKENPSFVTLCGDFYFEYAVLLKNASILKVNHLMESSGDSANISSFLNYLQSERKAILTDTLWQGSVSNQRKVHIEELLQINLEFKDVNNIRDHEIAHSDKRIVFGKLKSSRLSIDLEKLTRLTNRLKLILDYYYSVLQYEDRVTLEASMQAPKFLGFKTGLTDLVTFVNMGFGSLESQDSEVQLIIEDYKRYGK